MFRISIRLFELIEYTFQVMYIINVMCVNTVYAFMV